MWVGVGWSVSGQIETQVKDEHVCVFCDEKQRHSKNHNLRDACEAALGPLLLEDDAVESRHILLIRSGPRGNLQTIGKHGE